MAIQHRSTLARAKHLIEHLDRAQRLANAGSWEWDIATNDIIWSAQIYRMFGLAPYEFTPTYPAFLERVHPDDRDRVSQSVQSALDGETVYDVEHRIVLPDGVVRIVHEQGEVERDGDGAPVRMLGAVQDVTDLRSVEESSRRNTQMFAAMLRISPEAIVVTASNGRILQFSAGAEAMFGYAANEIVGQNIRQLMPARFRADHQRHVDGFAAGDRSALRMHERSMIYGQRKSGEEFPAEASLAKLQTADGVAFTTVVRDLSEWQAAEARLNEARERAEKASLAKSSFLANMSHEIRTPLNGILGVASALAMTPLDPRQDEMVKLVETSGRALEGLLSDILDFAKIDAGRMTVRSERFDLSRVVHEVGALYSASAVQKGVELHLNVDDQSLGQFLGDDLRIRQILSNLVSNSVKFTSDGQININVSSLSIGEAGHRIRVAVEDTGIGFAPEIAPHLFDRFEQADGSITRRFGGTGLGLAISKSLVELMGGVISASSTPGRGSVFAFELDLPRAAQETATGEAPDVRRSAETLRPLKVLLAEDHPINQRAVQLILDQLPIELTCVENGEEAVRAVDGQVFDFILMDMQMPVMDGLTAIRGIREIERAQRRARAPICTLTANAFPEHEAQASAAGSDYFLSKPISAPELIELVCRVGEVNATDGGLAA